MDEAGPVRGGEPVRCLAVGPDDLANGSTGRGTVVPQRFAVDELHDDVDPIADHATVVDRHDVGVRQAGERLALGEQAIAIAVAHQLDRDAPRQLGVARDVDLTACACACQGLELVAADADDLGGAEQLRRDASVRERGDEVVRIGPYQAQRGGQAVGRVVGSRSVGLGHPTMLDQPGTGRQTRHRKNDLCRAGGARWIVDRRRRRVARVEPPGATG